MMTKEEKKQLEKIFKRYHSEPYDKWPKPPQIAFDFGWLMGLILKLDSQARRDG